MRGTELLAEISDSDIGSRTPDAIRYGIRKAARAVVFRQDGLIALMDVTKLNYHKLPGGGIEEGEDIEEALRREVLEETGSNIKIIKPLGMTIEHRNRFKLMQTSYCFIAHLVGKPADTNFTGKERREGFRLTWQSLDDAIKTINKDVPLNYEGKFIIKRDLIFLKKAKEMQKHRTMGKK
jgi:ADP-ribose pyrophosphatase YjhB (NUDIX family)